MRYDKPALKRTGFISIFLGVIFIIGCERMDWHRTRSSDTILAYKRFIKKYDHSLRLMEAHKQLEKLYFEKAKKVNSIPAYETFLRLYSHGQLADSAMMCIEQSAFENAKRMNTIPALQDFSQYYSPVFYADSVRSALDQLYAQRHAHFRYVKTARVIMNKSLGENGILNDLIDLPFEKLIKEIMSSNGLVVTFEDTEEYDMLLAVDVNSSIIKTETMPNDSLSSYGISFDMNFQTKLHDKESVSLQAVSNYFPPKKGQAVSLAGQSAFETAFWHIGSFPTCLTIIASQCFGPAGAVSLLENNDKIQPHIIQAMISIDALDSDILSAQLSEINRKNMAIANVLVHKNDAGVTPFLVEVLLSENSEFQMEAMNLLKDMPDTSSIAPLIALTNQRMDRKRCLGAIETLGYVQNHKSMHHLIHLLQDREPDIRKAAVIALGNHASPTAVGSLIAMFDDEERLVANQSMTSLVQLGDLAIDSLKNALQSNQTSTVWRAMAVLGELRAENAIDDMIPLLNHPNSFTSWKAREILGQFKSAKIFQSMIELLDDPDMTEKAAAVLGHFGDAGAVQPLLASYNKDNPLRTKTAIIRALGQLRDPLATDLLLDMLNSGQIVLQTEAAKALGKIGDPRALPGLAKWYQTDDFSLKMSIIEAYGNYQQPKQTQRLLQVLAEKNSELRAKAVEMLAGLGEKSIINELVYLLDDSSHVVQNAAKSALRNMGHAAISSMGKILQSQGKRDVRLKIVYALKEIQTEQAAASLIAALDDPDPYLILNVKIALQSFGESAVSPLLALVHYGNLRQRTHAFDILSRMQEPRALPEAIHLLNSSDNAQKASAASLAGDLNYYPAVPLLLSCLEDQDINLVIEATVALGKIGSPEATTKLLKGLDSRNTKLVVETVKALGLIRDSRAITSLIEKSKSDNELVKNAANEALVSIGAPAVEPLIPLMSDPNHFTAANTAYILSRIGAPAVPGLLMLLKDTSATSWYAAEALGKIKDPRAIQPLIDSLALDDEYFYRIVKSALANIGEPAFESVVSLLRSDIADQRWKAIEVIYSFKEPSMTKQFIAALDDNDARVRFVAAKALQSISGKSFSMNARKWRKWYDERSVAWNI